MKPTLIRPSVECDSLIAVWEQVRPQIGGTYVINCDKDPDGVKIVCQRTVGLRNIFSTGEVLEVTCNGGIENLIVGDRRACGVLRRWEELEPGLKIRKADGAIKIMGHVDKPITLSVIANGKPQVVAMLREADTETAEKLLKQEQAVNFLNIFTLVENPRDLIYSPM